MIFAMPSKPGEFSRFDFPEVLPAPLNGKHFASTIIRLMVHMFVNTTINIWSCAKFVASII